MQIPTAAEGGSWTQGFLDRSEVVTLAVFGEWSCFLSERGFYRYASRHLRPAFPTLPYRGQFNRLMRRHYGAIVGFFRHLVARLQSQDCPYEALDSTGVPTREAKRRGAAWSIFTVFGPLANDVKPAYQPAGVR